MNIDNVNAIFEFTPDDYILAVWYAGDENGNNWLCIIKKDKSKNNDKSWEGTYRFRYKKDDLFFTSADEKSVTKFTASDISANKVIKKINLIQQTISEKYPDIDFVLIEGDFEKFLDKIKGKHYMQFNILTKNSKDNNATP